MPEERLRKERKTKTPEQALASLMRLCSRAEKSSGDALRLMRGWGVEPARQQGVLGRLIADKFIDDRRYAEAFTREKSRLNGWGSYKIRRSLTLKGVSREIIDETLAGLDRESVKGKLGEMIRRKARGTKAKDIYDLKAKLVRYGMSLGYEYGDVMASVEEVINELNPMR